MVAVAVVAKVVISIGKGIIECGGEVSRAEDSAERVCRAMGMSACEVIAHNSFIILCVENKEGESITLSRRIKNRSTDLGKLERLNELSRELCDGRSDIYAACELLEKENGTPVSRFSIYASSMAVCAVFALFFGGGIREAIASAISASITVTLKDRIRKGFGNAVISTFVCAVLSGMCGAILVLIGVAENYPIIAKGDIMLLVPGLSLICAGRDLICGELLTGLLGFIETVLIALALAAGFALPALLLRGGA